MLELLALYLIVGIIITNIVTILDLFDLIDGPEDTSVWPMVLMWPPVAVVLVIRAVRWASRQF